MAFASSGRLSWIPVRGDSMWPTLRSGDLAELETIAAAPRIGEVLVAKLDGGWVVHRVRAATVSEVTMQGDNCAAPDRPVALTAIVGKVNRVRRGENLLERAQWDLGPSPLGRWRLRLRRWAAHVRRSR